MHGHAAATGDDGNLYIGSALVILVTVYVVSHAVDWWRNRIGWRELDRQLHKTYIALLFACLFFMAESHDKRHHIAWLTAAVLTAAVKIGNYWLGSREGRRRYGQGFPQAAVRRSYELLEQSLATGQLSEWRAQRSFTVQGSSGGAYRIWDQRVWNIMGGSRAGAGLLFCAVPRTPLPPGDQLLAQKLWIEASEAAFLKVANVKYAGLGAHIGIV